MGTVQPGTVTPQPCHTPPCILLPPGWGQCQAGHGPVVAIGVGSPPAPHQWVLGKGGMGSVCIPTDPLGVAGCLSRAGRDKSLPSHVSDQSPLPKEHLWPG